MLNCKLDPWLDPTQINKPFAELLDIYINYENASADWILDDGSLMRSHGKKKLIKCDFIK